MLQPTKLDDVIGDARTWEEFVASFSSDATVEDAFKRGVAEAREVEKNPMPGPTPTQAIRKALLECFEASDAA